ncbi:hypothetical protein [Bacteroides sp. UBA939]|uniref:hypothetical protein n=1 Tax=Bacteroides sp. UBA939 TaxID=1946092 RepID=UPI0025C59EB7|nr:hypothetical protein [Bacteroides sp. UBA939]
MKNIVRYALILLACGYGVVANAQITLGLGNVLETNTTDWKYSTVSCSAPSTTRFTSIIISMVNNNIPNNPTAPPGGMVRYASDGVSPRTILYVFNTPIDTTGVKSFIAGITFRRTLNDVPGATPYVNITVDANPTNLPEGAPITVWDGHPDGSLHYYIWVYPNRAVPYKEAYEAAKDYYFQGMRGYLPTITSKAEDQRLTQISIIPGWSGGARTPDDIEDEQELPGSGRVPTMRDTGSYGDIEDPGKYYRWLCGPEAGFRYYYHAPNNPSNSTSGDNDPTRSYVVNGAYTAWNGSGNTQEPNNNDSGGGGENVMQINFSSGLNWNDYSPTNPAIKGFFVEFGGNGQAYTVTWNNATAYYQANAKYNTPTTFTTNDQWERFSPGNKAVTTTTFKSNSMRSNVLVIDDVE